MAGNSRIVQKNAVLVEVSVADGTVLTGKLFTTPQTRVIDTLNDDRVFIPFEAVDGTTYALAKTNIQSVRLPAVAAPIYRGSDPYMILGVSHAVTATELKEAYRNLAFTNHPDRLRGLGLGGDFIELATQNMMRINNAYAHILRALRVADAGKAKEGAQPEDLHAHAARRKAS